MTYNDYGHLRQDPKVAALVTRSDRNRSSPLLPGTAAARPRILRDHRLGLVRWGRHSQGGRIHRRRPALDGRRDSGDGISHGAYRSASTGIGTEKRPSSFRAARTNWARFNRREPKSQSSLTCPWIRHTECQAWTIPFSRGGSPAMGAFTMGILRLLPFLMLLGGSALAQSPTYGVGSTPSAEEIRAWISLLVLREWNSRRGAEAPRKARWSIGRKGARYATGRRGQGAQLPLC